MGRTSTTPWSVDADRDGDLVKLIAYLSVELGPPRMFAPFLTLQLDVPHATMLVGQLIRALSEVRDADEAALTVAGGTVFQSGPGRDDE